MLPLSGETDGSVWILKCDYDDQLGPDTVEEICSACFAWLATSGAEWVTSATLTKVVTDLNFKKIIDIHVRLKESGSPTLFPNYLVRLASCTGQTSFLILYTFITGETPSAFSRCRVGSIPTPKLARVMEDQGLGLDLMPMARNKYLSRLAMLNQEKASAVYEIQTITDSDSSQEQPIANKSSECSLQEPTFVLYEASNRLSFQILLLALRFSPLQIWIPVSSSPSPANQVSAAVKNQRMCH